MTRAAVLSPALSKEVRALLPLWAATVAACAAAFVWRDWDLRPLARPLDVGLMAYVAGSIAMVK